MVTRFIDLMHDLITNLTIEQKGRFAIRDSRLGAITVAVYLSHVFHAFIRFVRVSLHEHHAATVPSRHAYFERHANYLRQTLLSYGESYTSLVPF